MGKLHSGLGAAFALATTLAVTACAPVEIGSAVRQATPSPSATETDAHKWVNSEAFTTCRETIASVQGAPDPINTCRRMTADYTFAELEDAFSDPEQTAAFKNDLLAQISPIDPHFVLNFSGTGSATVTWSTDTGMIQRQVALPYSEEIPLADYVNSNVVQIPAQAGVGCSIVLYSNDFRDGQVVVEVAPVDGQTMASCVPDL